MTPEEFVEFFIGKYTGLIKKVAYKYSIPNRYSLDDLVQYMAEKMQQILIAREGKENKIEDPEKYFKSCLDFYCIEFQRMHGFVFGLPKRPRKNAEEDEARIKEFGFKYLGDITVDEKDTLHDYDLLSEDIEILTESSIWDNLTGLMTSDEANVMDCVIRRSMTWKETSNYLDVPQSTCWFRKNRVMKKIYDAFERMDDTIESSIKKILREDDDAFRELSGHYTENN